MAKAGLSASQLFFVYLCFLFPSFKPGRSGHIVGWAAFNYVSHSRVLWKLGKELQARGHKYTQILPNCTKESYDDVNVKVFNLSLTDEEIGDLTFFFQNIGELESITQLFIIKRYVRKHSLLSERFCKDFLEHKPLIAELTESVDLVLCDFTNMCCFILADMLNVTRVDVSLLGFGGYYGAYLFGYPLGYLSAEFSSGSSDTGEFSFTNRLLSFVYYVGWQVGVRYAIPYDLWEMYARRSSRYTNAFDAWRTRSIGLIPHDFTLEYSRPLRGNVKAIGPLLPEPARELPDYLNRFMTKNDKVVLVSFSTCQSKFPTDLAQVIADGLSNLSLAVLWKHIGDNPINVGNNIKIVPWIPRNESSINDILGHPSTKVFVTHGGLNSVQESVYHRVPMVVIPMVFDQFKNARIVKQKGLGMSLDWKSMKPEDLTKAIQQILNNTLYYEKNAKSISALMKDRKQTPSEEGADWIEYALRHDGARHLTSDAMYLPEYKLYMFDVFLFLLILVFIILFIFVRLCCCVCRRNCEISVKEKEA